MKIELNKNFLGSRNYNFKDFFRRLPIADKNFSKYTHPWMSSSKKKKQVNLYRHLEKKIITELSFFLNREHNQNNSYQYWYTILSPWCSKFLTSVLEVNSILQDIQIKNIKYFETSKLNTQDIVPSDYMDFCNISDEDFFRNFLAGLIIKKNIDKENIIIEKKREVSKLKKEKMYNAIFFHKLYLFLAKYLFTKFKIIESLNLQSFFTSLFHDRLIPIAFNVNYGSDYCNVEKRLRIKLYLNLKNNKLEKIINEIMPFCLPKTYLENYLKIFNEVKKFPDRSKVFSDGIHLSDDVCRIFIASFKKNKSNTLNIIQHGGGYQCAFHSMHSYERKIANNFLSWGKPLFKNENQIFSSHIKSFFGISKQINNQIIVPVYCPSIYNQNITTLIGGKQYEQHYKDLLIFLENLKPDLQKLITLRFPSNKKAFDYIVFFKKKFKNISIENSAVSFKNELKFKNICISTTYATTLLQAYASKIPVICFWRKDYYLLRKEAKNIFSKMKKNNLYFNDPVLAARFLNKNYQNIDKWWNQKAVKSATNQFRSFFCYPPLKKV
jgi:putative transferase (TIGR04331 family)